MSRRPDLGRGARLAGALVCAVAGLAVAGAQALAAVSADAARQDNVVTLSDDDSARAMFDVSGVAPGRPVSRCLEVGYEGNGPALLRLYGSAAGTGLAPHLSLRIEQGQGGGFASCAGFAGNVVYTGTLAGFVNLHHDFASGLPLSAQPGTAPATYRFTAVVADVPEAQGRNAAADIWWEAQTTGPGPTNGPTQAPSPAPPRRSGSPTPQPTQTPTGTATPPPPAATGKPSATGSPKPTATPSASATALPVVVPTDEGRVDLVPAPKAKGKGDGPVATAVQGLRRLLDLTAPLATEGTKQAAFPSLLILLAFLFLLVQDRIDRRDPKLALAPVHADPDLTFRRLEDRS